MNCRIITAMIIAMIFLITVPTTASGTSAKRGNSPAPGDYLTYEFLQRETNRCSVSGSFTMTIASIDGSEIGISFSGQGLASFPGETDPDKVRVGYYTSTDSLRLDRSRKDLSNAARIENGTTEFSFSCKASAAKSGSVERGQPDWNVSHGPETVLGIAFHRETPAGGVNFTSMETLLASGRNYLHIDPDEPPENIRLMEYGFDLEFFGNPNKHYSQLKADVLSYVHDDVFWMDYGSRNGFLLYYGFNDLFIDSPFPTFYYRIIETNVDLTEKHQEESLTEPSLDKYLPGLFSVALLLALGIEVVTGRFGVMENKKKGIFVLFILLLAASLLSIQFWVIRDEHRVVPTERELFDRKYDLEVIGLEYEVIDDSAGYMAEVNISMRNTGSRDFEERGLEIVFSAEKYGIEIFTSHGERDDDFTEIANERVLHSGKSVTFFYNIPLGKEDPRWVDITLRIRVEAATQKGDILLVEEVIPVVV